MLLRNRYLLASLALCLCLPSAWAASGAPKSKGCAAPPYRQFDFWVGDWDAYDFGKPDRPIARDRVDAILGGCVIQELYRQKDGLVGRAFSIYDATRGIWHQTWVTNHGQLLVLEGAFRNNRMVLTGSQVTAKGQLRLLRGTWSRVKDGVREVANTSDDGGKTWRPLFDIVFLAHR